MHGFRVASRVRWNEEAVHFGQLTMLRSRFDPSAKPIEFSIG